MVFDPLVLVEVLAGDAVGVSERAVGLNQELGLDAGPPLQRVNVLGVDPLHAAFVLQEADEHVRRRGAEVARIELLGQKVKGPRVFDKVVELKDSRGVGQVVLLQVVVQACAWAPKVGDA